MEETRQIMGMPVTLNLPSAADQKVIDQVFDWFEYVDRTYSPYKDDSVVSKINRGELAEADYSDELREILAIAEQTKAETKGYFDVWHDGAFDPSGIVKGWAIQKATELVGSTTKDFYIEAGGDIQVGGNSPSGEPWKVGIRNPFERTENISVVSLDDKAIATSGTAIRGEHIYNPHDVSDHLDRIVSLSVIGDTVADADRYATAAFAMGEGGIAFIESLAGFEGYMVDRNRIATQTSGWAKYEMGSA